MSELSRLNELLASPTLTDDELHAVVARIDELEVEALKAAGYSDKKHRVAERQRALSAAGREVGPLPEVGDPARRAAAVNSLRVFCETYSPDTFFRTWSAVHLVALEKLEQAIATGGKFALAMPRGWGKTSLMVVGVLWAVLSGRRRFVFCIAANDAKSKELVSSVRTLLTKNELLKADFPEVCVPLWALEGIHQRKLLLNGKPISLSIKSSPLILPDVPGSPAAQARIQAAGLHSAIRGAVFVRDDGQTVRPDLLLIDDPQTDDSAGSVTQTQQRWARLRAAVMGMSGGGQSMSAMASVTVIKSGDLAEMLLDHKKAPDWQGERHAMLPALPQSERWEEYARLRSEGLLTGQGMKLAGDYYAEHRDEMDEGGVATWPECFKPDEVSAIQHGMNFFFEDAATFWCEMQQQPDKAFESSEMQLTAAAVTHRLTGLTRGVMPAATTRLTAFIDVQERLYYFAVVAWSEGFTGSVIDYGAWPQQKRSYFTASNAQHTLDRLTIDGVKMKGLSIEERWLKTLTAFSDELFAKDWQREGGGQPLRIERAFVDAQYGKSTDTIYRFIAVSPWRSMFYPSHGFPVGPQSIPLNERRRREGEITGNNWRIGMGERRQRHVIYDANFWKSFLRNRLIVDTAARGALRLFGTSADAHQMIADHILSEKPIEVDARGRRMVMFAQPSSDNHLLDCCAGNCVVASSLGMQLEVARPKPKRDRQEAVQYLEF